MIIVSYIALISYSVFSIKTSKEIDSALIVSLMIKYLKDQFLTN